MIRLGCMTPEYLSSLKMSYPCGYEYLLGQQQALTNIQLIYPGVPATPAGEEQQMRVRSGDTRPDVFMIHYLSGMQKLAIKIFEAVQIINVRVKYV